MCQVLNPLAGSEFVVLYLNTRGSGFYEADGYVYPLDVSWLKGELEAAPIMWSLHCVQVIVLHPDLGLKYDPASGQLAVEIWCFAEWPSQPRLCSARKKTPKSSCIVTLWRRYSYLHLQWVHVSRAASLPSGANVIWTALFTSALSSEVVNIAASCQQGVCSGVRGNWQEKTRATWICVHV